MWIVAWFVAIIGFGGRVVAQDATVADVIAQRTPDDPGPRVAPESTSRRRTAIVAELSSGAATTGLGTVAWAAIGGPDPVVIAVISASPLLLGSGTFSLMHGGARLRVHRALLRGESSDVLRTSERLAGRRQLVLGSGLLVTGLAFSMVGTFAGQGGGPRPVFMGVFAGVGGASGASGFFMMEHAIYRVRFGRRGLRDPVAIAPTVRILAGGATLGLGGAI